MWHIWNNLGQESGEHCLYDHRRAELRQRTSRTVGRLDWNWLGKLGLQQEMIIHQNCAVIITYGQGYYGGKLISTGGQKVDKMGYSMSNIVITLTK